MKRVVSSLAGLAGAAVLVACGQASSQVAVTRVDPLLKPIEPEYAARWLGEQASVQVHGNTYLVGFEGLTVALIRTSDGLILVDGALPQAVPAVEANIRALGFRLEDVKYILSTEPHYDHAGGIAALARDTGATVIASPAAVEALARGRSGPDDPQAALLATFPPVQRLSAIRDGETLRLGEVIVTARATPGHTPGSMSWTWRSCEADDCRDVVFSSSLNPISADGFRFSDPRNRTLHDGFLATFALFRSLPCDILLTAHPDQPGVTEAIDRLRQAREPNPFVDPAACRAHADRHARLFERRLERERAGTADSQ
ncbi:subclass B3 metallo-beta-lactamase [Brevundimonas sp.]|uniref:subclass B3 metallo-beta-lactamase n=1 Tax=Brevundimonas sp. TaxID=1871086 RepID=UPI002FC9FAF1